MEYNFWLSFSRKVNCAGTGNSRFNFRPGCNMKPRVIVSLHWDRVLEGDSIPGRHIDRSLSWITIWKPGLPLKHKSNPGLNSCPSQASFSRRNSTFKRPPWVNTHRNPPTNWYRTCGFRSHIISRIEMRLYFLNPVYLLGMMLEVGSQENEPASDTGAILKSRIHEEIPGVSLISSKSIDTPGRILHHGIQTIPISYFSWSVPLVLLDR